jgi:predicted enzyme related to lactoylglutathione lyase
MSETGYFVWYELMTTDMAAAEAFYRNVVGWSAEDAAMPDMAYTLLKSGETNIAGLMLQPNSAKNMGMPPAWLGYVGVPNVDEGARSITAMGGKVLNPAQDIPGVGRFAVVADPQGAAFALFTGLPGQDWKPSEPAAAGHVGWHELYATDGPAAFNFYASVFGWSLSRDFDMGDMGVYKIFSIGGRDFGGVMTKPAQMPVPAWTFYFNVPAIDAGVERVKAGGGQILNGPMEVPGGSWIVQAIDPQGAMFALVAPVR